MKNLLLATGLFMLSCSPFTGTVADRAEQTAAENTLEGIWLGSLIIPEGELRIAVTISGNTDGTFSATLNSIDQGSGEIPFDEVKYEKDILFLMMNIGIEIEGEVDLANETIESEFRQGEARFPLVFKYVDELPGFNRPQEPVKPYPYNEQEVEYENKEAGVKLAGTLTFPDSGGPFPAVILLTGSGQQNRNEEVSSHKPFLVLADYLTRQGIAVLRADDRGVGGSTGDFSQSTTGDFADDALAGVEYLKSRKEINAEQIGLIGHSEGGSMAPIAAAKSSAVAFIVMTAGPGQVFDDIVIFQLIEAGMSEEDIALLRSWYKSIYGVSKQDLDYDAAAKEIRRLFAELSEEEKKRLDWTEERLESEIPDLLNPWWRYYMAYDPRATLMRVKCPVLAINGEKDTQVPSKANLPLIEEALEASGNMNFQVKELPGLNHLFQTAETGDASEYAHIEETMSPDAMKIIADWILARTR